MIAEKIKNQSENLFSKNKKDVTQNEIENLEKKCRRFLSDSTKNLNQIIETFNSLIKGVGTLLSKEIPDNYDITTFNTGFKLMTSVNYVEPISLFIKNIYINSEYRTSLRDGDDDYFLGRSSDILKNHVDVIGDDEYNVSKFFEFKNYWVNLSENTKQKIKDVMSTIVGLVDRYIEIKDDSNDIAKILIKLDTTY